MQLTNTIKGWGFSRNEINKALFSDNTILNPSIDLTNACNLNCLYCFNEEKNSTRKKRKVSELTLEETFRAIDDFSALQAQTINIVGSGEPTIDQYFYDIINHIDEKGITTVLFTNGLTFLKDNQMLPFLFEKDVSIVLKYNSDNDELQDAIVRRKGYKKERDKILKLLIKHNFNKPQKTRLGINTIAFKGNLKELPKIHKYCRKNNIFPITTNYIPAGRTKYVGFQVNKYPWYLADLFLPLSIEESIWLSKQNREIDKQFQISWNDVIAYYNGSMCTQILGLYVDIIGNIWPCVSKSKRIQEKNVHGLLGNVKNGDSIIDVWSKNNYLKHIRENFNGGCPYKDILVKLNSMIHY